MPGAQHLLLAVPYTMQAEADFAVQLREVQQKLAEAERRLKHLTEQRDVLQQQLEKAASEVPGEGECCR